MKNVLLIDSGTGGANVLLKCVEFAPCCNFLLFCDNANLPYGEKTKKELIDITISNLEKIQKFFRFDIVILACNTLTSTVIESCREKFDNVVFIGTEPAVKPALERYKRSEICVLATKTTIENNRMILNNGGLKTKVFSELARLIDENLDNLDAVECELKKVLHGFEEKALVLGCTHYFSVLDIIKKILPRVEIFSSEVGVAKRLKSLINKDVTSESGNFQVQIMTSKDDDFLPKLLWYFNEKSKGDS